ncbi:MAG: helicase-related protein [Acidimicrobiia bacterium]
MPVDVERLQEDARVRFPGRAEIVTLVKVKTGPFWEFFFEGPSGPGKVVLAESELAGIEFVETPADLRFDGDAVQFRLGIEARRIDIAFAYDMAAVAVSNIQPLPHQLEAVYGCFLREPRLRFLLADDPGAGKTIMAGLYMKELILRRAGDRILVVTPANLRPQWVRELAERFQLDFVQLGASHFDASLTENPWDQFDRVVVSRDFLRTDRARESFDAAEREWDLAVIDEAHGFTLSVDGRGYIKDRTERYKAAEAVARSSHRLVLMTATPHSGRNHSLWGLLRLLDLDAWGDRCPTKFEVPQQSFRKVSKEIMTDMAGQKLFKDRHPHRVEYELVGDEWDLYEAVTDFVSRKLREIRGESSRSTAGFALTTMQRRVASSTRAIRRTLERRLANIEKALEDPEAYLRNRRSFQASLVDEGEDLDDLEEEDRWLREERALEEWLPDTVYELEAERDALGPLLTRAQEVEAKRTERKLTELLEVVRSQGLKEDRRKQLLIFTEHKDTLDYLVENLSGEFEVAVIHGQMKLPDRIAQERFFREKAQIMVATEAAGEGINLQFCHLMVNYDIPWNPNRLEQRMGRIHRIGQTQDVHIFNLIAANTREGYVLNTLLKKMENMGIALGDKVFDVVGLAVATNLRELIEAVLAGELTKEEAVESFGGAEADPATVARANDLLESALARHHLDWQTERDRHSRAEERRLPPTYFERFFLDALTFSGGKASRRLDTGTVRVDRSPDTLVAMSRTASSLRRIEPEYARLTFDKSVVSRARRADEEAGLPAAELCGPGHPLFDALVSFVIDRASAELAKGAVFFDPDATEPVVVRFLVGDVVDGNGEVVRRSLAVARVSIDGRPERGSSASLYDVIPPNDEMSAAPSEIATVAAPVDEELVMWARQHLFEPVFDEAKAEREHVAAIQSDFLRRSFGALLAQADQAIIASEEEGDRGVQGAEGRLRKAELVKEQYELRRSQRIEETERGRRVSRGDVTVVGSALLLPLPDPTELVSATPASGEHLTDAEVEHIAVQVAREYEQRRGATVRSVESDNVGFDLLSLLDLERRCIEVKGRAGVGRVELTWSEFAKCQELGDDYWLYVVLDCGTPAPRLYRVQNPAQALAGAWQPSLDVRYRIDPEPVIEAARSAPA